MKTQRETRFGAVAAGHDRTAEAAMSLLMDGGNAFDAALAGLMAACVAEPVLASLGGGGFLTARRADEAEAIVFDFFTQTPKCRRPQAEVDFFPITADFGTAQQEFHIGLGSIAVPGVVAGLFEAHRRLGRAPLSRIIEPACRLARDGVPLNRLQAYIFDVVGAIYRSNAEVRAVYCDPPGSDQVLREGAVFRDPEFADTLESIVREGPGLFYRGGIAEQIVRDQRTGGGHLGAADLADYRVEIRRALTVETMGARLFTNPAPSTGGVLVGLGLRLCEGADWLADGFGTARHVAGLARAMGAVNTARSKADGPVRLSDGLVADLKAGLAAPQVHRGTTHISVIDQAGNAAALTVSNGEGSGYPVPGTGIMLNNMLGEEDINPHGFHAWPEGRRMGSMMAPSLVESKRGLMALGSGGSNRIRSAVWQVALNVLAFEMDLAPAIAAPRLHREGRGVRSDRLSIEGGFGAEAVTSLTESYGDTVCWDDLNLFFGGVHGVMREVGGTMSGAGDPRRGGVFLSA